MSELNGNAAVATVASTGNGAAIAKSVGAAAVAVVVNYTFGKEDPDYGNANHAFAPLVLHTTKDPSAIIPGGVHQGLRPMLHPDNRALRKQKVLTRRRHNASTRTV